jgi:predicted DNA-binding transcriptional regulator AlpA
VEVNKVLYTTREASIYLGYSMTTIRSSRRTGYLGDVEAPKHLKLGESKKSHVRYEKKELDAWIARIKEQIF